MPLPNVTFTTVAGGLGRLPEGEDYVSAIIMPLTASPAAWSDPVGKKYLSLQEAEADLIIDGDTDYGLLWYFIKEYFRVAGPAELYVINFSHGSYSTQKFYELTGGRVRQAYRYAATAYAGIAAFVGTLQTFADAMAALYAPIQMIASVKDESTAVDGGSGNPDLRALNSENVSVLISGDNSNKGKEIATSLGVKYIPAAGAVLGALSKAGVHESIAWVAKFNLQQGAELQKTKLSDGTDIDSVTAAIQDSLNTKGYLFLKRHLGVAGSYLNDTHDATLATSDYAYIENNRTMQKAKRNIRAALLPDLNSPLTVDADGKLAPDTVKYFENKAGKQLGLMVSEGNLSGYQVIVDPEQNVLSTSKLIVICRLQPRGVARYIDVNIGFTISVG